MKKLWLGAGALALTAGLTGAAQAEFSLTILHINDFHSRFESITGSDSTCNAEGEQKGECFGGIARLKTAIDAQRDKARTAGENVVLLSAGDEFQGSLFYTQYRSEIVADFMNDMGFDVAATGNHEFDDGPEEFAKFLDRAKFPIIGGNFDTSKDADLKGRPPGVIVLTIGGEKVGVVGATTEDTPDIASPGPNVAFESVAEYVKGAVGALEEAGINKIIVLSHIGYVVDQELAKAVPGIDVIVGGHSHTFLGTGEGEAGPYPTLVKNPDGVDVPIVQAGQYGKVLGELKVTWDDAGKVTSATGAPILLDASVTQDQGFADRLAELGKPLEALKAEVIGTASAPIEGDRNVCRVEECSMGNLVADAQLARVADQGITISIANSGGLRASIDQGEITMGEVLTVLPFSNTLATFQLKGADLVASLENGLSQIEEVAGRFPQVAGPQVHASTRPSPPARAWSATCWCRTATTGCRSIRPRPTASSPTTTSAAAATATRCSAPTRRTPTTSARRSKRWSPTTSPPRAGPTRRTRTAGSPMPLRRRHRRRNRRLLRSLQLRLPDR